MAMVGTTERSIRIITRASSSRTNRSSSEVATADAEVGAIVDAVEEKLRAEGYKPARREGQREGRWVLIDFGDIIVHVQHEEEREYYALERLWKDCPEVDLGAVDLLPRPVAKGQAEPGGPDEDSVDPVDSGVDEA